MAPPPPSPPEGPASPAASEPAESSLATRAAELIRQFTERHGGETPSARREGVISLDEESPTAVEPKPRAPEVTTPPAPVPAAKPAAPEPPPPAKPLPDPFKLPPVEEALQSLESVDFLGRIWVKDAHLWNGDTTDIRNRLGWLTSPTIMQQHVDDIRAFADEIRRVQFSHVVLLGMGGSSLSTEVFNHTFGSKMGFPDMLMLDSTDSGAVKRTLERVNVGRTLFVVSTKSGTTTETLSFYAFFRHEVEASKAAKPGTQFVAITDPGTPLDKLATDAGFRRTFLNPASIGGRYSALSFFGLVPAALIGVDLKSLLERAQSMVEACAHDVAIGDNPGVRLGAALAGLARVGRDKVTLVFSDKLRTLGGWIEQLLAESLGKNGHGLVPVDAEPLGAPSVDGDDRLFVAMLLKGDQTHDAALAKLGEAGHPVIRFTLADPLDVGGEFFRWELATAAAGALLGVNPFDEPNVLSAKEKTAALLLGWKKTRRLLKWGAATEEDGITLITPEASPGSVAEGIAAHLAQARPGDYFALQAYLTPSLDVWNRLQEIRIAVRDRYRVATTVAYGPRYLHSTGQLHKGGPANGLFVQVTAEDAEDVAIPGAGYGFSTLKAAQALGDFQALSEAGRRVIRVHLRGKPVNALEKLVQLIRSAVKKA